MNLLRMISRRILSGLPLLLFLPLITFGVMHLAGGNYFDVLRMDPQISKETIVQYEKLYHLDQPVWVQYLVWVKNLCRFDFGYSFAYKRPVLEILGSRLAHTLLLTLTAFFLGWLLAIIFGLLAGLYPNKFLDRFLSFLAYSALSIPGFFLCILLLYGACRWTGLPLGGLQSVGYEHLSRTEKILDLVRHMMIPVFVLGIGTFAQLFRVMRAQTLEIKDKEFVLFLRSCRVPGRKIIFKHIARNAMNPLISLFGLELPALFSGAALVEIFTGWPGLGQMMLQAVRTQDLFLVLGNMVMIAILLVLGNLIADIFLVVTDPRIKFGRQTA